MSRLNSTAYRILGQVAALEGDERSAESLMQISVRQSLRESVAAYWLLKSSYEKGNYQSAVRYADILLRTRPQLFPQVQPFLVAMAEIEAAKPIIHAFLANDPSWRSQFISGLPAHVSDPSVAAGISPELA